MPPPAVEPGVCYTWGNVKKGCVTRHKAYPRLHMVPQLHQAELQRHCAQGAPYHRAPDSVQLPYSGQELLGIIPGLPEKCTSQIKKQVTSEAETSLGDERTSSRILVIFYFLIWIFLITRTIPFVKSQTIHFLWLH